MNPFSVVFVLAMITFIATGIFTVLAPGLGITLPTAPSLPTLTAPASGDWLGAVGYVLTTIGQYIWFFFSYIGYMVSMVGTVWAISQFGIFPAMVGVISGVTLMVMLIGSILLFIRGYQGGQNR